MTTTKTISAYLEKNLGTPSNISTAKDHATGEAFPVLIHRFDNEPCDGAITCCTVGLSDKIFALGERKIRHELIFAAYGDVFENDLYPMFFDIIKWVMQRNQPIRLGEIIDSGEALIPGSVMQGFWLYSPVYFPEAMMHCTEVDPPAVFVWLIPLGKKEIGFIEVNGHKAFSQLLEQLDPDLLDWKRQEIIF